MDIQCIKRTSSQLMNIKCVHGCPLHSNFFTIRLFFSVDCEGLLCTSSMCSLWRFTSFHYDLYIARSSLPHLHWQHSILCWRFFIKMPSKVNTYHFQTWSSFSPIFMCAKIMITNRHLFSAPVRLTVIKSTIHPYGNSSDSFPRYEQGFFTAGKHPSPRNFLKSLKSEQ